MTEWLFSIQCFSSFLVHDGNHWHSTVKTFRYDENFLSIRIFRRVVLFFPVRIFVRPQASVLLRPQHPGVRHRLPLLVLRLPLRHSAGGRDLLHHLLVILAVEHWRRGRKEGHASVELRHVHWWEFWTFAALHVHVQSNGFLLRYNYKCFMKTSLEKENYIAKLN